MADGDYVRAKDAQIPNGGLLQEIFTVEVNGETAVVIKTAMQHPKWAVGTWAEDVTAAADFELVCTTGTVTLTCSHNYKFDAVVVVHGT